jgi:hypothetical protein
LDIPGTEVSKAIENLWKQDLFANVKNFMLDSIEDGKRLSHHIHLTERPRPLQDLLFRGVKKSETG